MRVSLLVIKPEILDFFYGLWYGKFSKVILDIIIDNFLRTGIGFFFWFRAWNIVFFSHGNMWSLHFGESFCQSDIGHHRKEVTYRHSEEHYILSSAHLPQIEHRALRIWKTIYCDKRQMSHHAFWRVRVNSHFPITVLYQHSSW